MTDKVFQFNLLIAVAPEHVCNAHVTACVCLLRMDGSVPGCLCHDDVPHRHGTGTVATVAMMHSDSFIYMLRKLVCWDPRWVSSVWCTAIYAGHYLGHDKRRAQPVSQ